jgi:DNA-binding NarL/FixJ family response regulator
LIRILLADDHAIVRDGLRRILSAADGLEVTDEAVDGHEVIAHVRKSSYDLVLLDMSMPGRSGIDLIKHLKDLIPKTPVLVLSMHAEEQYALRAIRAGASGYLSKDTPQDQLVAAIRKVAAGGIYLSGSVAEQMAMNLQSGSASGLPHQSLSDRELEVLLALVAGESVGALANRLHLSVKTVSTHKARIHEKMAMASVAELVQYAMSHRLIESPG